MPEFTYTARDLNGVDHKGTIEIVDASRAARILSKRGLIIIDIKEQNETTQRFDRLFSKVSFNDVVIATRQLATMVESGLVLSEAFDILVDQQSNPLFKKTLEEVSRDIKSGLDLATALKKHPEIFSSLYINLVRAGEQAGNLDVILSQMATNLERDREFRSRIRGAMIYPAMILAMMFVVMGIMLFFVVPRLTSLYSQSNIELPLPTQILIGTSNFFIQFWWLLLIMIIIATITFKKWVATPSGKYTFDSILLKLPVIGKVVQETALTNFTRTFGLLAAAGIPILDALNIVSGVLGNAVYKKALEDTYQGIERGLTLSAQLEAVGVFPKIIPQMFRVGEETGKIDKVSFKLAEYFESESDHMIKNLTVIIEPVILVILGIGVAFLVLSIILPIYKLTSSLT